jgi:hypothetical protein
VQFSYDEGHAVAAAATLHPQPGMSRSDFLRPQAVSIDVFRQIIPYQKGKADR